MLYDRGCARVPGACHGQRGKPHADDWRFGSHRRVDGGVPRSFSHDKNRNGLVVFLSLLPVQDGRLLAAAVMARDGNSLWLDVWPVVRRRALGPRWRVRLWGVD